MDLKNRVEHLAGGKNIFILLGPRNTYPLRDLIVQDIMYPFRKGEQYKVAGKKEKQDLEKWKEVLTSKWLDTGLEVPGVSGTDFSIIAETDYIVRPEKKKLKDHLKISQFVAIANLSNHGLHRLDDKDLEPESLIQIRKNRLAAILVVDADEYYHDTVIINNHVLAWANHSYYTKSEQERLKKGEKVGKAKVKTWRVVMVVGDPRKVKVESEVNKNRKNGAKIVDGKNEVLQGMGGRSGTEGRVCLLDFADFIVYVPLVKEKVEKEVKTGLEDEKKEGKKEVKEVVEIGDTYMVGKEDESDGDTTDNTNEDDLSDIDVDPGDEEEVKEHKKWREEKKKKREKERLERKEKQELLMMRRRLKDHEKNHEEMKKIEKRLEALFKEYPEYRPSSKKVEEKVEAETAYRYKVKPGDVLSVLNDHVLQEFVQDKKNRTRGLAFESDEEEETVTLTLGAVSANVLLSRGGVLDEELVGLMFGAPSFFLQDAGGVFVPNSAVRAGESYTLHTAPLLLPSVPKNDAAVQNVSLKVPPPSSLTHSAAVAFTGFMDSDSELQHFLAQNWQDSSDMIKRLGRPAHVLEDAGLKTFEDLKALDQAAFEALSLPMALKKLLAQEVSRRM